jgi:beta-lactamase superfamily II metal-dependent hydrolase
MEGIVTRHEDFIRSDILKIPHQDGPKKNKAAVKKFLKCVSPEISIFSVEKNNRYDRPSEYIVSYLTSLNSMSYNTAEDGAIVVSKDYGSWRVDTCMHNKTNFFIPYLDN